MACFPVCVFCRNACAWSRSCFENHGVLTMLKISVYMVGCVGGGIYARRTCSVLQLGIMESVPWCKDCTEPLLLMHMGYSWIEVGPLLPLPWSWAGRNLARLQRPDSLAEVQRICMFVGKVSLMRCFLPLRCFHIQPFSGYRCGTIVR